MPKLSMMVSRMLVAIVLVLVARIAVSADTIENANLAFSVAANGYWELLDKTTNEVWRSNPDSQRFARVTAASGSSTSTYSATSFASMCNYSNSMVLVWSPNTNIGTMRFAIQLLPDGKSVKVSWAQSGGTWHVTDVRFPDSSFRATAAQGGSPRLPQLATEVRTCWSVVRRMTGLKMIKLSMPLSRFLM